MPSKVLSTQNPILFFFFFPFPVSESCKSTYTAGRASGEGGEEGRLGWSGRRSAERGHSAHLSRGVGDPWFSAGSSPELDTQEAAPLVGEGGAQVGRV